MSVIEQELIKNRPSLSKSSVKTYESILRNLYNKIWDSDGNYDIDKFDNTSKVINYLKDVEPRKRKTLLSALVIISDKKEYRELMLDDIKVYNKEEAKQTKTDKQNDNWVNKDEISELYEYYKKNTKCLLSKKKVLSIKELQSIQNFVILAILGGVHIPPRRSKDFVDFKIRNIDKEKDNYLDKNKFIFNSYKTAKVYGKQEVTIPNPLKIVIKMWMAINPTDYLLFDSNKNKLSNVKLTQRLNTIFGKDASVNQMRKTYLSDKYSDMIDKQNEMKVDFKDMGSSILQEKIYIKK